MAKKKIDSVDFDSLVGRIQATSEALQQDALVVINRSVTARAWLTGYYIVEYEQRGADRAKYGEGLLKKLAERLNNANFALPSLKNYRAFYRVYPEVGFEVAAYLRDRFGKSYTVCSLLPEGSSLALSEKGYTMCSQSSTKGLLAENGEDIRLKCHVLIELKAKKFNRADAVQLGMYMEYYRKRVMEASDNPPIGLLLCTEVGKEAAEYIAPYIDERLFLSEYQLQLPAKEQFTAFLKKENEGLPAAADAKSAKIAKKRKGKESCQ